MNEKKRKTRVPAKMRCKVRVIAQPIPTTPTPTRSVNLTPTVSNPTVATTSTQTPMVKSAAAFILMTVYDLAKGKFDGVPYPSERPQAEENPSTHNSSPPQPEAIPNGPTFQVREDTPWPDTVPASINLFKARAHWPITPTPAPSVKVKNTEVSPQIAAISHAMVLLNQIGEKCTWGLHCPICKKEDSMEDWNGHRQRDWPITHYPQNLQHPQTYDFPERYSQQIRLRREWDEKMECLNEKYNLDYYSSLESDSDF